MRIDLEQALDDIASGATRVAEPVPVDRVLTRMHRRRAVRTAGSSVVGVAAAGALAVGVAQGGVPSFLRGTSGVGLAAATDPSGTQVQDEAQAAVDAEAAAQTEREAEAAQAQAEIEAEAGLAALLDKGPVGAAPQCGGTVPTAVGEPVGIVVGGPELPADSGWLPIVVTVDGDSHLRVDEQSFYAVQDGVVVGTTPVAPSGTGPTGGPELARGTVTGGQLTTPQTAPPIELCAPDGTETGLPLPAGTYDLYAAVDGSWLAGDPDSPEAELVDPATAPVLSTFTAHSEPLVLVVD